MKKQLMTLAVIGGMMASTAQAFVPLSNSQINLGSFRNNATRGMFYTELDIFSASPVEISVTEANYLSTNWANLRTASNTNFPAGAGAGTYDAALGYSTIGNGNALSGRFLTLGLSGQPLWFLPVVKDIRAGVVFQNSGNRAGSFDMDGNASLDEEWKVISDSYTITNSSVGATAGTQVRDLNRNSDLQYFTNNTNNQWDAGASWKGFILKDFDIGASFSRRMNQTVRTTRGTRTYKDNMIDESGNAPQGFFPGTTEVRTYTATLAGNSAADMNSTSQTDALAQARIGFLPFLTSVSAGAGIRIQRNDNPGSGLMDENGAAIGAAFEKDDMNRVLRDLTPVATGPLALLTVNAFQVREDIQNRGTVPTLDYAASEPLTPGAYTATLLAAGPTAGQRATLGYKDSRSGAGPLIRLEVAKKFEKVRVSVVGNFSSVKQTIDATRQLRAYGKNVFPLFSTRSKTLLITDYTQDQAWTGSQTTRNLDGGAKFDFLAMDGVNLALGGFISQLNTVSNITSASFTASDKTSFDDGDATSQNAIAIFSPTARPFDGAGGEGTWSQTITRQITGKVDTLTTQISVPVGVEIPLSKKWTFRAGTRYVMQKTKMTTTTKLENSKIVTQVANANPGGVMGPTTTYTTVIVPPATESTVVTYPTAGAGVPLPAAGLNSPSETHFMEYSYGIQFDPTKSLSLAANAFLDTNPRIGNVGANSDVSASLLDLNTYRLLAIQAVFKF